MLRRSAKHNNSKASFRPGTAGDGMTYAQVWHLVHRVIIATATILYCTTALYGSVGAFELMRARKNPTVDFAPETTALLGDWVGTTTVVDSPLMRLLHSQVTPRNNTLYVDVGIGGNTKQQQPTISFAGCSIAEEVDSVYANAFLRSIYDALVRDASYNLTFFSTAQSELIVSVVNCTSLTRTYSDSSVLNAFYPMRNKQPRSKLLSADRVKLLTVTLSNQGYKVSSRDEKGSVEVATLTFLHSEQAPGGYQSPFHAPVREPELPGVRVREHDGRRLLDAAQHPTGQHYASLQDAYDFEPHGLLLEHGD